MKRRVVLRCLPEGLTDEVLRGMLGDYPHSEYYYVPAGVLGHSTRPGRAYLRLQRAEDVARLAAWLPRAAPEYHRVVVEYAPNQREHTRELEESVLTNTYETRDSYTDFVRVYELTEGLVDNIAKYTAPPATDPVPTQPMDKQVPAVVSYLLEKRAGDNARRAKDRAKRDEARARKRAAKRDKKRRNKAKGPAPTPALGIQQPPKITFMKRPKAKPEDEEEKKKKTKPRRRPRKPSAPK